MTAFAEGSAGLALVMSVALLCTWRIGATSLLLAVQSAAVALAAVLLQQPPMALPPLLAAVGLLVGNVWGASVWGASVWGGSVWGGHTPAGNAAPGILGGVALAILALSYEVLGLPLAIVLLAIVLVATRQYPLLQVMGLIALQNGLVLAGCLVVDPALPSPLLLPVVCLVLPLPIAAHLLIPPKPQRAASGGSRDGWIDLGLSIAMFAATLIVPLDGFASVFAPLLGFDAIMRSCRRRKRHVFAPPRRLFALLQSGFGLLAVCAPDPIVAWLAIVGAMAAFLLPRLRLRTGTLARRPSIVTPGLDDDERKSRLQLDPDPVADRATQGVDGGPPPAITGEPDPALATLSVAPPADPVTAWPVMAWPVMARKVPGGETVALAIAKGIATTRTRHWDETVLAFSGAGVALFGLLMLPALPSILGTFSVLAGFTVIAVAVPDLALVLVILLLRLASQSQWLPGAEILGSGIALIALLACAHRLMQPGAPHRATLLQLGQCSIAALAIASGEPDGRFAALVLLILLILTRSAARIAGGVAPTLAMAGLGGVPPLGVFPALVLVVMVVGSAEPWLLLPLGVALIPMFLAGLPRHPVMAPRKATIPSVGWLPLALALLVGYFAPSGLVYWWHMLTAGAS
jgi:hypothetical protein